jgi:hypothetical protein
MPLSLDWLLYPLFEATSWGRVEKRASLLARLIPPDRDHSQNHHCCMRHKLTSKLIEHVKAPGPKRMDLWDIGLPGFGVRVSPNGHKSWFVMARIDGRQTRFTMGTYPAVSLAEAREAARR